MARADRMADPDALPFGKLLAWAGAGVSGGASFILLGYVSLYATDTLGISPAIVGGMILVASFANVVGGLFASYIVDRSPETRLGKARPYELAVLGIWLATWALFSVPSGLDQVGRTVWLFVTYLLINTVFDTVLRANDTLYMARAFANRRVYAKVYTRSGIFTTIASIALSVTIPMVLAWAGKDPERWSLGMLAFAVPLALIGMTRFFFVKEEFRTADSGEPPVKIRELLAVLGATKWVWLLAAMMFLTNAINGANMISYYFRYVVGDLALQGVAAAFGILALPVILFFPRLMKRFTISQILVVGAALGLVGAGLYWAANGSVILVTIGSLLAALATLPTSYLIGVMILDICAYNEWRGKRRLESTMGAAVGVFGRIGVGVAGLVVGQVLQLAGYDGTSQTQSPAALDAITGLFAGVPTVVFAGIILLMVFYGRFDRTIMPVVEAEIDDVRAARLTEAASLSEPVTSAVEAYHAARATLKDHNKP